MSLWNERNVFGRQHAMVAKFSIPDLSTLIGIHVSLKGDSFDDKSDGLYTNVNRIEDSSYSNTIKKCRELIFSEDRLMASPIIGLVNVFAVTLPKALLTDVSFSFLCSKLDLKIGLKQVVNPEYFEMCLNYTLITKVSPSWNKLGNFLVNGELFLSERGRITGVQIHFHIYEREEACFSIDVFNIKLSAIKLEDLDISPYIIAGYLNNQHSEIDEFSIGKKWVHVLPSLKKGEIVNITRQISPNPLFQNYQGLKNYWKDLYGYCLPVDENMTYYNIAFQPWNNSLFTYPACCIQQFEPLVTPQNPDRAQGNIFNFLKDLHHCIPKICGINWLLPLNVFHTHDCKLNSSKFMTGLTGSTSPIHDLKSLMVMPFKRGDLIPSTTRNNLGIGNHSSEPSQHSELNQHSASHEWFSRSLPDRITKQSNPNCQRISMNVVSPFGMKKQPVINDFRKGPKLLSLSKQSTDSPLSPFLKRKRCLMPKNTTDFKISTPNVLKSQCREVNRPQFHQQHPKGHKNRAHDGDEDLDIAELARLNKLSKVNKTHLKSWLESNGLSKLSKLKKSELIDKIQLYVKLMESEP